MKLDTTFHVSAVEMEDLHGDIMGFAIPSTDSFSRATGAACFKTIWLKSDLQLRVIDNWLRLPYIVRRLTVSVLNLPLLR